MTVFDLALEMSPVSICRSSLTYFCFFPESSPFKIDRDNSITTLDNDPSCAWGLRIGKKLTNPELCECSAFSSNLSCCDNITQLYFLTVLWVWSLAKLRIRYWQSVKIYRQFLHEFSANLKCCQLLFCITVCIVHALIAVM